jgi:hypothetical protein
MPVPARVRRARTGVDYPMRLAGIRAGDIVRVHDGLPYLAEVIGHDGPRVRVTPITGPTGVRTVTSRDVVDHWRKTRSRQPGAGGVAGPSRGSTTRNRMS